MVRSVGMEVLLFRIILEYKHFGNRIMFKEEAKSIIIMVITMRVNSHYHKRMGKDYISGKIKQDIRGNLGVIIWQGTAGSNIFIINFTKVESQMEKEKVLEFIDIQMEMSLKESGRMMKSLLDSIGLVMVGPLMGNLRKIK